MVKVNNNLARLHKGIGNYLGLIQYIARQMPTPCYLPIYSVPRNIKHLLSLTYPDNTNVYITTYAKGILPKSDRRWLSSYLLVLYCNHPCDWTDEVILSSFYTIVCNTSLYEIT